MKASTARAGCAAKRLRPASHTNTNILTVHNFIFGKRNNSNNLCSDTKQQLYYLRQQRENPARRKREAGLKGQLVLLAGDRVTRTHCVPIIFFATVVCPPSTRAIAGIRHHSQGVYKNTAIQVVNPDSLRHENYSSPTFFTQNQKILQRIGTRHEHSSRLYIGHENVSRTLFNKHP